jgi:hypothetical protein
MGDESRLTRMLLRSVVSALAMLVLAAPAAWGESPSPEAPTYPLSVCNQYQADVPWVHVNDLCWYALFDTGYQASATSLTSIIPIPIEPTSVISAGVPDTEVPPEITLYLSPGLEVTKPNFSTTAYAVGNSKVRIESSNDCSGVSVGSLQSAVTVVWQPFIGIPDNPVATGSNSGSGCGVEVIAQGSGSRSIFSVIPPVIGVPSEWSSTHTASVSGITWTSPSGAVIRYQDGTLAAACHIYFPLPGGFCTAL